MGWQKITPTLPIKGSVAKTCIKDDTGIRNEEYLKRGLDNNFWWTPDGKMYVYYTPTHYWE